MSNYNRGVGAGGAVPISGIGVGGTMDNSSATGVGRGSAVFSGKGVGAVWADSVPTPRPIGCGCIIGLSDEGETVDSTVRGGFSCVSDLGDHTQTSDPAAIRPIKNKMAYSRFFNICEMANQKLNGEPPRHSPREF